MIAGRSPLALTYTALAFGIVVAPCYFFGVLMHVEESLRLGLIFTLLACTLVLALRLVGWSKLGFFGRSRVFRGDQVLLR